MRCLRIMLLNIFLAICLTLSATARFESICVSEGIKTEYGYTFPHFEKCENSIITIEKDWITVDGIKYEVATPPCNYIVRRHYKYTVIECISENIEKVCVKVLFYDDGRKYIIVAGETSAKKYGAK